MEILNSLISSRVKLCHHEEVILSLETSWYAVSLSKYIGCVHPYDDTDSISIGTVETTWTASTPSPSDQSVTVCEKPSASAAT